MKKLPRRVGVMPVEKAKRASRKLYNFTHQASVVWSAESDGRTSMNNQYRNRDLLDLAYQIGCQAQLPCCVGGPGEPMHSNQSRHGKGGAMKAHDCFFASGCRACHREIDQGKTMNREEKFDVWQRAHERTLLALFRLGLIGVSQ